MDLDTRKEIKIETNFEINNINLEIKKLEDYISSERLFDEDLLAKIKSNFLLIINNTGDNIRLAEKSLSIYKEFISSIVNGYKRNIDNLCHEINDLTEKIRKKESKLTKKISLETLIKVKNDFYGKILVPHDDENTYAYLKRTKNMMCAYLKFISYF